MKNNDDNTKVEQLLESFNKVVNHSSPEPRIKFVRHFLEGWVTMLFLPLPALEQLLTKFEKTDLVGLRETQEGFLAHCKELGIPEDLAVMLRDEALKGCKHVIARLKVYIKLRPALIEAVKEFELVTDEKDFDAIHQGQK